ncbi:hypothetical protein [Burkholderia phage vB_BpP_HN05]
MAQGETFLPFVIVYSRRNQSPMSLTHWLIWQCAARTHNDAIEAFEKENPDCEFIEVVQTADFNKAIQEAEATYRG